MGRRRVKGIAFDMYGTLVDVLDARSLGFRASWINRAQTSLDPFGPKLDLVVSDVEELAARLS